MKYVYTRKIKLVDTIYNPKEVLNAVENGLTRELHEIYPAPQHFAIPNNSFISAYAMQLFSIWYNRGTCFHFEETYLRPACTIRIKHSRTQWCYDMVNELPPAYIKQGYTTPQSAYAYGKKLIEAVNRANLIPFEKLEEGYKIIARQCLDTGRNIRVYSPNEKTIPEARAELETAHTINSIFDTSACTTPCDLPDEALTFYAKVFDIKMPEWFLRATNIRKECVTAAGNPYSIVVVLPFVDTTEYVPSAQFNANGDIKSYDGNETETAVIPTHLIKDARPQKLHNPTAERKQLAEQVMYFLSLPIEEQKEFMTSNYDYCTHCHEYFDIREGCKCGKHKPMNDDEYILYMATRKIPTEYVDIRAIKNRIGW